MTKEKGNYFAINQTDRRKMSLFWKTNTLTRPFTLVRKSNRVRLKGKVIYYPIQAKDLKPEPLLNDPVSGWTAKSVRTGLVATKLGMMHDYDEWGKVHALTVLHVDNCQVLQVKTKAKDGVNSIQIGAGYKKIKNLTKPLMGHFARAGVPPKRHIVEFPITPDAVIPVGTTLSVRHFLPGQFVDVRGIGTGKGFQGAMKRWGFKGLPASHGVSLAHRSLGSCGARKDPSKVWKGKKMAGRMGGKNVTIRNLRIFEIWPEKSLLLVAGAIPGKPGTQIRVRDALWKKFFDVAPPFPTYYPDPNKPEPEVLRGKFPKPWPAEMTDAAHDLHVNKLMTDVEYRKAYILKNAPKFDQLMDKLAKQMGIERSEPSKKLFLKKVDDKTLNEITRRYYKGLKRYQKRL